MKMNPGMAFGTGTHETTSMCIAALQGIVAEGDEILDIGCGSGILSVTALLCGAKHADATDIDLNAVNVAYENAELNGVRDRLKAEKDNVLSADRNDGSYRIILYHAGTGHTEIWRYDDAAAR